MDMDMSGLLDGASNWVGERASGLFGQSPPQPQAAPSNPPTDRDSYDFSYIEEGLGLPEGILYALMMAESGGDTNARSSAGAQGAFQLMPDTSNKHGANPWDLNQAALAAGNELKWQLKSWGGDVDKALASYNYGHGNVRRHGGDLDRISRVQIANSGRAETQEHNDRFHRFFGENRSQPQAQPQAQPKQIARKPNNETGFNYQAPAYGTEPMPRQAKQVAVKPKKIPMKKTATKKARPDMTLRKSMPQSVPSSMFGLKLS